MSVCGLASPTAAQATRPARSRLAVLGASPTVLFVGMGLAVAAMRASVLAAPGVPSGVDGGNWLAFGHSLLGDGVQAPSLAYPPLIPLVLTGACAALGPTLGVAIVAALSALAPAGAAFLVLRGSGLGRSAAGLGGLLLLAPSVGDMASWGGYPQLLGSGLALCGLWLLDRWLRGGQRRIGVAAGIVWALVLGTSHVSALIGALAVAAEVAWHLVASPTDRRRHVLRRIGGLLALLVPLTLPFAVVYARLVPALLDARHAQPALALLGTTDVPGRFASVLGLSWPAWLLGLAASAGGALLLRDLRSHPLWVMSTSLLLGIVLCLVLTRQPRILYEVPILAVLGLALWVVAVREHVVGPRRIGTRHLGVGILAGGLLFSAIPGLGVLHQQRENYRVLDPGLIRAIFWLGSHTPPGSLVAVPSLRDAPLGWWVQGLAGRPTLAAAPLRWLMFPEERRQAATANRIFYVDGATSERGIDEARAAGVSYVLLPKRSLAYALADEVTGLSNTQEVTGLSNTQVVYRTGDAIVIGLGPDLQVGGGG